MTEYVWPFRPTCEIVESLEWYTSVIRCRSAEQRLCKRPIPRLGYSHGYILESQEFEIAMQVASASSDQNILVPDWPNLEQIPSISLHTVSLPVATGMVPAYKATGKLLIWESNLKWEARTISTVGANSIGIDQTQAAYTNPTIVPLRLAQMTSPFASDREPAWTDGEAVYLRAGAGFTVYASEDLTPTYGNGLAYTDYLDIPVVSSPVEIINGARNDIKRELATLDSKTGGVARQAVQSTASRGFSLAWTALTKADLWNIRLWLHSRKGQQKNFWLPSQNDDLVITHEIGSGATSIEIAAVGFATAYTMPLHCLIDLDGVTCCVVHVTSAAAGDPGHELLTFDDVFTMIGGTPVYASQFLYTYSLSEIGRMSVLTPSRLATDHVEIQHLPGGAATVVVPTVEDPNTPELPS